MPVARAIVQSPWGMPTLAPEAVLFYKADHPRAHDETDFVALLPHLGEEQRRWLRDAIARSRAEHPWLELL